MVVVNKSDRSRCGYHACKKEIITTQCKYCKYFFCDEHAKPGVAGLPRFKSTKIKDKLFMDEFHKNEEHPCIHYLDKLENDEIAKDERYHDVLDRLSRMKTPEKNADEDSGFFQTKASNYYNRTRQEEPIIEEASSEQINASQSRRLNASIFAATLLLLLLIGFFLYTALVTTTEEKIPFEHKESRFIDPNTISFAKYLDSNYMYNNQRANLTGFLERSLEGSEDSGKHIFFIVDEENNKIILIGSSTEIGKYIPNFGRTKELYLVTGRFKKEYKNLRFQVDAISIAENSVLTN